MAPWDSSQTWFSLDFSPDYDLAAGDHVTVTLGDFSTDTIVTALEITDIDPDANIVTGITDNPREVNLSICEPSGCANRTALLESGNWTADFTGDYDIEIGKSVDAAQWDDNGNGTMFMRKAGGIIWGMIYAPEESPTGSTPGALVVTGPPPPTPPAGLRPAAGAAVQACSSTDCASGMTNGRGQYRLEGLPGGSYEVRGFSPRQEMPCKTGQVSVNPRGVARADDCNLDEQPTAPPRGSTVEPARARAGAQGPLTVHFDDPLTLSTTGCTGGTATFKITVLEDGYIVTGSLSELPDVAGKYSLTIDALAPHHGPTKIEYTIVCPGGGVETSAFFIYIDPSGVVKTVDGDPIAGATVTLLRSELPGWAF